MQLYSATDLAEATLPNKNFTLPQGLLGAIVQNVSAWWLQITRNGMNFTIPPWTIATYPIASAEGWSVSGLSVEPGGLTISENYVEIDYSAGPVQLSLVPMSSLPIYEQTVSGLVQVTGGEIQVSGGQTGVGEPVGVNQPSEQLGEFTDAGGGTTKTYAVPPGTHAIGVTISLSCIELIVQGEVTGTDYNSGQPSIGAPLIEPGYYVFPIASAWDTEVNITVKAAISTVSVYVSAILDTQAVAVQNSQLTPLALGAGNQGVTGQSVQVAQEAATLSAGINTASPGSATQTLIAAAAGKQIRLWEILIEWSSAAATIIELKSSDGSVVLAYLNTTLTTGGDSRNYRCHGIRLPVDTPLVLTNMLATAGPSFYGGIVYDLA